MKRPDGSLALKIWQALRITEFLEFFAEFQRIASEIRGVLTAHILFIVLGGLVLWGAEEMTFWSGQYLAAITALTIGYGDVTPSTAVGKVACIVLGVTGMVFMGLIVGVASLAVRRAVEGGEKSS